MHPEQVAGNPLVEQHGQQGYNAVFDNVQRRNAQGHEGIDSVNAAVDAGAHADEHIHGNAVELGELGQQVDGVEKRADDAGGQGSEDEAHNGPRFVFMEMVPDGGGQREAAAHEEIGEVAHEGGGGALEQQLQQNFNALNGDGSAWPQKEAAQQHGHLGEVQLVKFRGQEGQRKVQNDSGLLLEKP